MASSEEITWNPIISCYIPPIIKGHAKATTKPFHLKLFLEMRDLFIYNIIISLAGDWIHGFTLPNIM